MDGAESLIVKKIQEEHQGMVVGNENSPAWCRGELEAKMTTE